MKAQADRIETSGFNRLYQDGQIFEFSTPESLLDLDFSSIRSLCFLTALW